MSKNKAVTKNPVKEIVTLHGEIMDAYRVGLDKAIRIGELLTQEHAKLKHGEWLPWVDANLPFTDRTARNYIRVFENQDRLKLESVSDLGSAYKLLAAPREPRLEVHELGKLFPMISDKEIDEIAESIKEGGLIYPIVLYEGQILDGKIRYEACRRAGVKPRFKSFESIQNKDFSGSALEFIMAKNYYRQSLTPEEKAAFEKALAPMLAKERAAKRKV